MAQTTANMNDNQQSLEMLVAMGFPSGLSQDALRVCGGNVEQAANLLLSGGFTQGASSSLLSAPHSSMQALGQQVPQDSSSSSTSIRTINGPMSQYSVEGGKSACTCMGLVAADMFLKNRNEAKPGESAEDMLEPTFLQEMILGGLQKYNSMKDSSSGSAAQVEHLSAEEVLSCGVFPRLRLVGNVRQGILSRNLQDPKGMRHLLAACQQSSQPEKEGSPWTPSGWCCVLITKTPESVLVCLPPKQENTKKEEKLPFILLDSHPRPQQFFTQESYARVHYTWDDLFASLEMLFPFTDLGFDVTELMGAMYNAFDLYPLVYAPISLSATDTSGGKDTEKPSSEN